MFFPYQIFLIFGGHCSGYFRDIRLKICKLANFYMVFQFVLTKLKSKSVPESSSRDHFFLVLSQDNQHFGWSLLSSLLSLETFRTLRIKEKKTEARYYLSRIFSMISFILFWEQLHMVPER